jgi:hypothetical protein
MIPLPALTDGGADPCAAAAAGETSATEATRARADRWVRVMFVLAA